MCFRLLRYELTYWELQTQGGAVVEHERLEGPWHQTH